MTKDIQYGTSLIQNWWEIMVISCNLEPQCGSALTILSLWTNYTHDVKTCYKLKHNLLLFYCCFSMCCKVFNGVQNYIKFNIYNKVVLVLNSVTKLSRIRYI